MAIRSSLAAALGSVLAAASPGATAQSPAGSFQLGSGYVYPELEFAVQRDDNIALQPDAFREADTIRYVRPALRFDAKSGTDYYDAGYKGEFARYNSFTSDDRDNHELFAGGEWAFSVRNNLKLRGQYLNKADPRGTLQIITPTPNEYRQSVLAGLYTYGAAEAAGRLELQAGSYAKEYLNNRPQTAQLDHSRTDFGATLLMRVQPKTYASLAAKHYRFDYAEAGSARDSSETSVFAGLRWDITGQTSGKFSAGYVTKKFDSPTGVSQETEFSGAGWEGVITWKPLFYSGFEFLSHKRPVEATGVGDFVLNQTHQLTWTHFWGSRVSSILAAAYSKDSYADAPVAAVGGQDREDVVYLGSVRILYAVQRWLKLGVEYAGSTRDSNSDNFDYFRHQAMLLANFTL
jgi:hypothetical protein